MVDRLIEQERMQIWREIEDDIIQLDIPVIEGLEGILKDNSKGFFSDQSYCLIAVSPIYLNFEKYPEQIRLWHNPSKSIAYSIRGKNDGLVILKELITENPSLEQIEKMFEVYHLLRKEPAIEDYAKQYFGLILKYSEEYIKLCYQKNRLAHERNIAALRELNKRMDESIAKFRKEE